MPEADVDFGTAAGLARALGAWLSLACLLAGCPVAPAPPHVGPDGATSFLELGTGESGFESLVDGGAIELVHGPQGGYHVWASCRIFGLDPEGRVLHYVVATPDGAVLADAPLALMTRYLTPDQGGWLRAGDRVIFGGITGPGDVVGRSVVLRVTLEEPATSGDGGPRATLALAEHALTIVDALP